MSKEFVWFHNSNINSEKSIAFYESLLGWHRTEGPPGLTMFAGEKGPYAAIAEDDDALGWVPYVQVKNVDQSTQEAKKLGATLLKEKTRGPAGEFTVIRDPGGATLALWQKG